MLVHVRLLQGVEKLFTYAVPLELQKDMNPGVFVQVPFKNKVIPAIVDSFVPGGQRFSFEIKSIISLYDFPQDKQYVKFVHAVSQYYQTDSLYLFKRVQSFLQEKERSADLYIPIQTDNNKDVVLSQEQHLVYEEIETIVKKQQFQVQVLHGVTGSGKTQIYKKLIEDALVLERSVIVMLPEVTLALQFEKIFEQMGLAAPVIGFHSATTMSMKKKLWQLLLGAKPVVIIGVHLPVLLPIPNLGLIIIDEEHDVGYQEKKHPKINSKDMAILKASLHGIPIILGSATPSFQTLWNIEKRGWKLATLKKRYLGKFPSIEIVSLKEKNKRKHFWVTDTLYYEIQNRLTKKEQVIIFLNRRGYSFFVQCPCGFIFVCKQCSVSLTLHADHYLVCHYCGHKESLAQRCPSCNLCSDEFLKKGIGTQQIVEMLQKLFPGAVIARADADTTSKKRSWAQTVQDMLRGEIDILVGTQSITKGYHFPGVTLVGVLWADLNLHFPRYNASETTLQQLIQVAGRAGRQADESKVVIQTFDDHGIYQYLDEVNYPNFYKKEIEKRQLVGYPPCNHIAEIEIRHTDQNIVEKEAAVVAKFLEQFVVNHEYKIQLLGPIASLVYKVKGVFSQNIILKSSSRQQMIECFASVSKSDYKSSLFFTLDPV